MCDSTSQYPQEERQEPQWKGAIRHQFESWLDSLESDSIESDATSSPTPDLYSFYQELSALRMESMKTARRTNEVFSSFQQVIKEIETSVRIANQRIEEDAHSRKSAMVQIQKSKLLPFIELYVRLTRLADNHAIEPISRFWPVSREWKKAWRSKAEGLQIVKRHFQELLSKEDVKQVHTVGQVFDPVSMLAISSIQKDGTPPNRVVEEITPGFVCNETVIKLAEVKVSK